MAHDAGQWRAKRDALEIRKLSLESALLQRRLSPTGSLLTWLQAAAVPVALLGAIAAFYVGFGQLRQGLQKEASERFDRALTRLASSRSEERMTGVAGLALFFTDTNGELQAQALQYLINGLAVETDVRVQGAILDELSNIPHGEPSRQVLDVGLRTAINRDRNLTKSIVGNWSQDVDQRRRLLLAELRGTVDHGGNGGAPARVTTLSTSQYLDLLDKERAPFDGLPPAEGLPLRGLSKAIELLVAHGAMVQDFRGIFCEGCGFVGAKPMDGVRFDDAYLGRADFSHVSLRRSSFRNAVIGGTSFFGADLTNADLRVERPLHGFASQGSVLQLPILECAKLRGANLSGQPLVLFQKTFAVRSALMRPAMPATMYFVYVPSMRSAQLDETTKLDAFAILIDTSISDSYLKDNAEAPETANLTRYRTLGWVNWLSPTMRIVPEIWRVHVQDETLSTTNAISRWEVHERDLKLLGGEAYMLRGFVDQPTLQSLPLYSRFSSAVADLKVPTDTFASMAQARSDQAGKAWKTENPLDCRDPRGAEKLLELGFVQALLAGF